MTSSGTPILPTSCNSPIMYISSWSFFEYPNRLAISLEYCATRVEWPFVYVSFASIASARVWTTWNESDSFSFDFFSTSEDRSFCSLTSSTVFLTRRVRTSGSNGFLMKSIAPSCRPFVSVLKSSLPVRKMTGVSSLPPSISLSFESVSNPSISGINISRSMISGLLFLTNSSSFFPEVTHVTSIPLSLSILPAAMRFALMSSTTTTCVGLSSVSSLSSPSDVTPSISSMTSLAFSIVCSILSFIFSEYILCSSDAARIFLNVWISVVANRIIRPKPIKAPNFAVWTT